MGGRGLGVEGCHGNSLGYVISYGARGVNKAAGFKVLERGCFPLRFWMVMHTETDTLTDERGCIIRSTIHIQHMDNYPLCTMFALHVYTIQELSSTGE